MVVRKKERMELVYLKERMWCIYIHHSSYMPTGAVWICYPNVVRRYERYVRYACRGGLACACQEVGKHVVLPLTILYREPGLQHVFTRAVAAIFLLHT